VDARATVAQQASLDSLALETGPLENALRRPIPDAHVRLDAHDPVRERMVSHCSHGTRGDATASGVGEEPVAELDRVAQLVEAAEVRAAEDGVCLGVLDHVRSEQ